jgi:hypothetical protein
LYSVIGRRPNIPLGTHLADEVRMRPLCP